MNVAPSARTHGRRCARFRQAPDRAERRFARRLRDPGGAKGAPWRRGDLRAGRGGRPAAAPPASQPVQALGLVAKTDGAATATAPAFPATALSSYPATAHRSHATARSSWTADGATAIRTTVTARPPRVSRVETDWCGATATPTVRGWSDGSTVEDGARADGSTVEDGARADGSTVEDGARADGSIVEDGAWGDGGPADGSF
jgi:hypothetical protein